MLHKRYYKAVNQKSSFGDAMVLTNQSTSEVYKLQISNNKSQTNFQITMSAGSDGGWSDILKNSINKYFAKACPRML
jgi:hypothetical protein